MRVEGKIYERRERFFIRDGHPTVDLSDLTLTEFWVDGPCIICVDGAEVTDMQGIRQSGEMAPNPEPTAPPAEYLYYPKLRSASGDLQEYEAVQVVPPGNYRQSTVELYSGGTYYTMAVNAGTAATPQDLAPGELMLYSNALWLKLPAGTSGGTLRFRLFDLEGPIV